MIKARLKVLSPNKQFSESLIIAVKPDNLMMKGLHVNGNATSNWAKFLVEYEGKIETFISTLDDMLACLQAAKGTLRKISKNPR